MQATNIGVTINVEDIDAALQFGQCLSSKKWVIFYKVYGIVSCLIILVALLGFLFSPLNDDDVVFIIGGSAGGAFLLGVDLIIFFYVNSGKKKVNLWLQDVVILRAITQKADESIVSGYHIICLKTTAIQLRFSYLGKRYVKSSIRKGKISCLPVYNKYVDKEILIAYSPKYDQVMLIKPKSEQRILAELSK